MPTLKKKIEETSFDVSDPFYSEKNQARLARSIADAEAGKVTIRELIEVEDE